MACCGKAARVDDAGPQPEMVLTTFPGAVDEPRNLREIAALIAGRYVCSCPEGWEEPIHHGRCHAPVATDEICALLSSDPVVLCNILHF